MSLSFQSELLSQADFNRIDVVIGLELWLCTPD